MRITRRTGEASRHCITILLFALLLSACTAVVATIQPLPTATEAAGPVPEAGQSSYISARTIDELVEKSPLIVSGEFRSIREVINMARDGNDITKADPNILGVGQVYEFAVTDYRKGDGPNTIFVVQIEGLLIGANVGFNLTEGNIQKARSQYEYIPARLNNPYVLFLAPLDGFPSLKDYYTLSIHPWRFDISNPNYAVPESPWDEAINVFPPRKASRLLEQIANPELADDYPEADYPPPGETPYP